MVTIVIAYQTGTSGILATCLASIGRHTKCKYQVMVVVRGSESDIDEVIEKSGIPVQLVFLGEDGHGYIGSKVHGAMLDEVIPKIDTEYLLTLDSDCFPVADGWLTDLVGKMDDPTVGCAGILHPWQPPAEDMPRNKLEWRVRSQHCWDVTHVACQLVRVCDLEGMSYMAGDDTGLDIPRKMAEKGKKCVGFMATRCANPDPEFGLDPEFNRHICLIFGDKVYHHGGFSRKNVLGEERDFQNSFGWVEDILLSYGGAEFLLHDENSYKYKFDREEEVAGEKMKRLFGLKSQRMAG